MGAGSRHPLERLLAPVDPIPIHDPPWTSAWPGVPPVIECHRGSGADAAVSADDWTRLWEKAEEPRIAFSLGEAYRWYTHELWAHQNKPRGLPPAALNAFYRVKGAIPRRFQLAARRALIRWQGTPAFPLWPFDASVERLLKLYIRLALVGSGRGEIMFRWFWPDGARAAAILTHDVESADGLRAAVRVADLEQGRGLRSSFNLVALEYEIDMGIVRELHERGFEIGVHGLFHDRSMFSSRRAFDEQQDALRDAATRFGAVGFRSPATHRVDDWLAELPVDYDCTVPMSDPYEPQPGGCCSPWPYFIGDVVELPYTLPQDHTLFTLLGHDTIAVWLDQLDKLEGCFGLIQCVSHPDPGYLGERRNEKLYEEFLDVLKTRAGIWHALPRQVAEWWRARDDAAKPRDSVTTAIARLDAREEVEILVLDRRR